MNTVAHLSPVGESETRKHSFPGTEARATEDYRRTTHHRGMGVPARHLRGMGVPARHLLERALLPTSANEWSQAALESYCPSVCDVLYLQQKYKIFHEALP
jgi:hypothetical protein